MHGADVARLARGPPRNPFPSPTPRSRAIAASSARSSIADCLPVLFADRAGTAVGIAHAGWRGLAAGVLEATVAAFDDLRVDRADLVAWLGPAIGPRAFEVGDDVRDAFRAGDPDAEAFFVPHRPGKWHADLCGIARRRLARGGVAHVGGGGFCTYSDPASFFSYRRERRSGRMAAAVWLTG